MAYEVLTRVIDRASTEAAFRVQLALHPEHALASYDLTDDERAVVLSDRPVQSIAVDKRVSKLDNPAEPGDAWSLPSTQ